MFRRKSTIFQIFVVFSLAAIGWAEVGLARVTKTKVGSQEQISVQVDGVKFSPVTLSGQEFLSATLEGVAGHTGILYREGMPQIPVVRFLVGGKPSVKVGASLRQRTRTDVPWLPVQPSRVKQPNAKSDLVWNKAAYATDGAYPTRSFTVEKAGSIRGMQQYQVTLFPVRLSARTGEYEVTKNFTVTSQSVTSQTASGDDTFAFIVGQEFKRSPSLAAYAKLKEQLGYTVRFFTVGEDVTTPDDIRQALKGLYDDPAYNLMHALVIGDAEQVPGYNTSHIKGITDHYYRAIDTDNYSEDINGPDIGVGRVSVKTEEQLAVVLDKFTRYVRGNFSQEAWLDQVAFIATDDRWEVAEGTHNYVIETYTDRQGYTGVFPQNPMTGGDQLYAITHRVPDSTVHSVMNDGRTIINYSGHGGRTLWAGPHVEQSDVRAMTDENALPFVISNACITGDFRTDESFGETWQRHGAGAITFWGSMDNTYWDEDDILERRMYDGIYKYNKYRFDEITNYALAEVWQYYGGAGRSRYYWETYVLFGDPSLQLRTTPTQQLTLTGPDAIPVGVTSVQYTLTNELGAPVSNARVVLSLDERGLAVSTVTDETGVAKFNVGDVAREPAAILATAEAANGRLLTKAVDVIAADTPFLGLENFTVNGRDVAEIYSGESVALDLTLTNLGLRPTAGGTLEILDVTGPATLTSGTAVVPAMSTGESADITGALSIQVTQQAQAKEVVRLQMMWATKEGVSSKFAVTMVLVRGQLSVTALDYGDASGAGHEGIRPGEQGAVYLTVKNTGNDKITDMNLRSITAASACVSAVEGVVEVAEIQPGQSVRLDTPFMVTADATCGNGDEGAFHVVGSYSSPVGALTLGDYANFIVGVTSIDSFGNQTEMVIPDKGPEVYQTISFPTEGKIVELGVFVKIAHRYIGDLMVSLVHPDGDRVTLHGREGAAEDNIEKWYGLGGEELKVLELFKGKEAAGDWKLAVKDEAAQDEGTLERVELKIRGYFP